MAMGPRTWTRKRSSKRSSLPRRSGRALKDALRFVGRGIAILVALLIGFVVVQIAMLYLTGVVDRNTSRFIGLAVVGL